MNARNQYILAMLIFGTTGIVVHYIALPSSVIATARALLGIVFLGLLMFIMKKSINWGSIRKNLPLLITSGILLGINWALLFEAYRHTTVATATLCTYMAPAIIMLASPFVLGEKLTAKKFICVLIAIVGMVFVSGILDVGFSGISELKGVALALIYAVFYAVIVILNKKTTNISGYELTLVQIGFTPLVLIPYTLMTESITELVVTPVSIAALIYLGAINTGAVYALYFGALSKIKAQTAAILSYIDPIVAIVLSALVLHEEMSMLGKIGAILILGSMIVSESFTKSSHFFARFFTKRIS